MSHSSNGHTASSRTVTRRTTDDCNSAVLGRATKQQNRSENAELRANGRRKYIVNEIPVESFSEAPIKTRGVDVRMTPRLADSVVANRRRLRVKSVGGGGGGVPGATGDVDSGFSSNEAMLSPQLNGRTAGESSSLDLSQQLSELSDAPASITALPDDDNKNSVAAAGVSAAVSVTSADRLSLSGDCSTTVDDNQRCHTLEGHCEGQLPGIVGIANHRNTCFINAIVQCLSNSSALVERLLASRRLSASLLPNTANSFNNTIDQLGDSLANLLHSLWTPDTYTTHISSDFHRTVRHLAADWYNGIEQHDAHEFLVWLLDRLHDEELKKLGHLTTSSDGSVSGGAGIDSLFRANYKSTLVCLGCQHYSDKSEPFITISLPIPYNSSSSSSSSDRIKPVKKSTALPVYVIAIQPHGCSTKRGATTTASHCRGSTAVRFATLVKAPKKMMIGRLKKRFSKLSGIPKEQMCLVEVCECEFKATLHVTGHVTELRDVDTVYAVACPPPTTPRIAAVTSSLVNVIALSVDARRGKRLSNPFVLTVSRDLTYAELQLTLLQNMPGILRSAISLTALAVPSFHIRLIDTELDSSQSLDQHLIRPLHAAIVQQLVREFKSVEGYSDGYGPHHIKLMLEWNVTTYKRLFTPRSSCHVIDDISVATVESKTRPQQQQQSVMLNDCLQTFTDTEQLEDDNQWFCEKCRKLQQGTKKKLTFSTLPEILVMHLKRFKQENCGNRTKIESLVEFPVSEGLDLGVYMDRNNNHMMNYSADKLNAFTSRLSLNSSNTKHNASSTTLVVDGDEQCPPLYVYDLFAVCNHSGTLQNGHYTAFCRNPLSNDWYTFDDSRVIKMLPDGVVTRDAYLLFYQHRSTISANGRQHLQQWIDRPSETALHHDVTLRNNDVTLRQDDVTVTSRKIVLPPRADSALTNTFRSSIGQQKLTGNSMLQFQRVSLPSRSRYRQHHSMDMSHNTSLLSTQYVQGSLPIDMTRTLPTRIDSAEPRLAIASNPVRRSVLWPEPSLHRYQAPRDRRSARSRSWHNLSNFQRQAAILQYRPVIILRPPTSQDTMRASGNEAQPHNHKPQPGHDGNNLDMKPLTSEEPLDSHDGTNDATRAVSAAEAKPPHHGRPPTVAISQSAVTNKFKFWSKLFQRKSSSNGPSPAGGSSPEPGRVALPVRGVLRHTGESRLSRSMSTGRINSERESDRPRHTVRWDDTSITNKTEKEDVSVIPKWKRPENMRVTESCV